MSDTSSIHAQQELALELENYEIRTKSIQATAVTLQVDTVAQKRRNWIEASPRVRIPALMRLAWVHKYVHGHGLELFHKSSSNTETRRQKSSSYIFWSTHARPPPSLDRKSRHHIHLSATIPSWACSKTATWFRNHFTKWRQELPYLNRTRSVCHTVSPPHHPPSHTPPHIHTVFTSPNITLDFTFLRYNTIVI